ncbi:MAG TPA: hypothetical protein VGW74_08860 [Propionibacteriaceae bacterium]|nr:hypothetical protein [Propionibacteriaceae bacterium]
MTRFVRLRRSIGRVPGTRAWRYFRSYEASAAIVEALRGNGGQDAPTLRKATGLGRLRTNRALDDLEARGSIAGWWPAPRRDRRRVRRLYRLPGEDVPR